MPPTSVWVSLENKQLKKELLAPATGRSRVRELNPRQKIKTGVETRVIETKSFPQRKPRKTMPMPFTSARWPINGRKPFKER